MIARDGECISLWQQVAEFETVIPLKQNEHQEFDVVIVGAGITGITTGYLLQLAGKKCLIVEANSIGFGTTGGTTAHLNTLLDTPYRDIIKDFGIDAARQVKEAATYAINFIKKTINTHSIDCQFEETSAFLFSQDDQQLKELKEILESCEKVGLDVHYADAITVPISFTGAFEVGMQGKFHPLLYVHGLAKKFEEAGGTIVQHSRVTGCEENGTSLHVTTETGDYNAHALIYATHIPTGINLLHLRCAPWRSYAMAVTLNNEREYPSGLAYDLYDPYHYYRTQQINDKKYLIVGGEDHKTGHVENTESQFLRLESHIRKYFDVKEIAYRWSSQYFDSADGLPYIGHLPGVAKNIYVATGYGGNGMIYGTIAGRVLCNIITQQNDELISLFSPSRLKPVAGFTNFMSHNLDVMKEFAGKILSKEKLQTLADISPGEGKVVKYENQVIALSKDMKGNIHALNSACTHMKCTVSWNLTEQSWDCPCHGARYSRLGKVLTGPADRDLKLIISGNDK